MNTYVNENATGNLRDGNSYYGKKKEYSDDTTFNKLLRRLKGVNGQWTFTIKRYKDEQDPTIINKRVLIYITIPINRDIEEIKSRIDNLGEMTVSKGKIYIDDTKIDDIKLLSGVISIKNIDKVSYVSYKFLGRILSIMFNDKEQSDR